MTPYASRTGTRRNLDALRYWGWRLLVSARGVHRDEGFPYAIDNGAWTAHQRGEPFDGDSFRALLASHGRGADWIVVPDVVADARASLEMSRRWLPEVERVGAPMLIAVQDGMSPDDVRPWVRGGCGIFLGGSTDWKLSRMQAWGDWCRSEGAHYHVARVNTVRRIHMAQLAGAHSIDGSSVSRFAVNCPRLSHAVAQTTLDLTPASSTLSSTPARQVATRRRCGRRRAATRAPMTSTGDTTRRAGAPMSDRQPTPAEVEAYLDRRGWERRMGWWYALHGDNVISTRWSLDDQVDHLAFAEGRTADQVLADILADGGRDG